MEKSDSLIGRRTWDANAVEAEVSNIAECGLCHSGIVPAVLIRECVQAVTEIPTWAQASDIIGYWDRLELRGAYLLTIPTTYVKQP